MAEQLIGKVTHYFGKANVAAIQITDGELRVGDTVHIVGHTSDFTQKPGDHVGVQVIEPAREHDQVFRVLPD
jgi:hypothetical protein